MVSHAYSTLAQTQCTDTNIAYFSESNKNVAASLSIPLAHEIITKKLENIRSEDIESVRDHKAVSNLDGSFRPLVIRTPLCRGNLFSFLTAEIACFW